MEWINVLIFFKYENMTLVILIADHGYQLINKEAYNSDFTIYLIIFFSF